MLPLPTEPFDARLGRRIRELRVKAGMSQSELGAALSLSYQQVQKHENGTHPVTVERLFCIARALGSPVDAFLVGMDDARREAQDGHASSNEFRRLAKGYREIGKKKLRLVLLRMVEWLG